MGAGGGTLETGFVFRMVVEFTTTTNPPNKIDISGDPMYQPFVHEINDLISPGEWMKVGLGGVVLVRGPIETPSEARDLNLEINRLLRGLRVRRDGTPTGVQGRVVENIGPAPESKKETGAKRGPNLYDNDWSAPA